MELVLSPRDRDVAAHHADPQQRHRLDHAGRPIPMAAIATSTGSTRARRRRPRRRRGDGGRRRPPVPRGRRRGGGGQLPYWGKYVYHDNNRDINLSQLSMRAITDWYFTAHPPIMHDLHEAQPLMYTYSGGPPQNPNLDPILFARAAVLLELGAGADDEVGHAGRVHARVHGRLVAGLPRLGRLQPQRHDADVRDAVGREPRRADGGRQRAAGARRRQARAGDAAVRGAATPARQPRRAGDDAGGGRGGGAAVDAAARRARRRRGAAPARRGRCSGAPAAGGAAARRRWSAADARPIPTGTRRRPAARVVSRHSDSAGRDRARSRAATTRTTWRPACCRAPAHVDVPATSCSRTST